MTAGCCGGSTGRITEAYGSGVVADVGDFSVAVVVSDVPGNVCCSGEPGDNSRCPVVSCSYVLHGEVRRGVSMGRSVLAEGSG